MNITKSIPMALKGVKAKLSKLKKVKELKIPKRTGAPKTKTVTGRYGTKIDISSLRQS